MWGQSLPWHKVLNAVVAELSIYKWRNQRGRIDSLLPWVSRLNERLSAKLRVTENRCVLFNSFTYIYIYVLYKYFKRKKGRNYILVASFFPLKIFVPLCFNVLSTVPRENRLADSLCPIYLLHSYCSASSKQRLCIRIITLLSALKLIYNSTLSIRKLLRAYKNVSWMSLAQLVLVLHS